MDKEKLQLISEQFKTALARLGEVLAEEKSAIVRDAAIQRFEFVFDLSWKFIKIYLQVNQGIACASPKSCWREAYQQKIITYDDIWLQMTDDRNRTVHTYDQKAAEEIFNKLPKYFKLFQELEKYC